LQVLPEVIFVAFGQELVVGFTPNPLPFGIVFGGTGHGGSPSPSRVLIRLRPPFRRSLPRDLFPTGRCESGGTGFAADLPAFAPDRDDSPGLSAEHGRVLRPFAVLPPQYTDPLQTLAQMGQLRTRALQQHEAGLGLQQKSMEIQSEQGFMRACIESQRECGRGDQVL
jgi:hypothetical protein